MDRPGTVNIADVIDNSRIGGLQITLFLLCAACLILDGFDVQATGYVASALSQDSDSAAPSSLMSRWPVSSAS